ncbi:hypothetical protein N7474_009733 [Penicillium riverlandense]|uniref:uncharacterized protein n=1 Tax=Penicillium riverlandense TaxID=1903569 RepID=UPI0025481CC5|nr:uncharacterized protein N7474_009733 [Penicillium riverlandense]KAJ5808464.1 hypothetical protein N7474_009733 [Penicillium riverlandense]
MEDSMPNVHVGEVSDLSSDLSPDPGLFESTTDRSSGFVYASVESLIYPSTWDDEVDIQTSIAKARVDGYEVAGDRVDSFVKQTLNAFLSHLPNQGKLVLCEEIMRCASDDQLYAVYCQLKDCVLLPMLIRTPDDEAKLHDKKQRQLHEQCLNRDGDACVATRIMDTVRYHDQSQPDERVEGLTDAVYIVPRPYEEYHGSIDEDSGSILVSSAWLALRRYFPSTAGALDPRTVRSPGNMLTLWDELAKEWDRFGVSLEPTAVSNHYIFKVHPRCEGDFSELADTTVQMKQGDSGQTISLPHMELIRVHHIIAAILAQSGITEYLQSILFKRKNMDAREAD